MIILFPALAAVAAERPACVPVAGERIQMHDLAQADARFAAAAGAQDLGASPTPGAHRTLLPGELAGLAGKNGIETAPPFRPVCFERPMRLLTKDEMQAALDQELGIAGARIEVLDFSRFAVPVGRLSFPAAGLAAPPAARPDADVLWRGAVLYGTHKFPVWARVRVTVEMARVVAREYLRAGTLLSPANTQVENYRGFPPRMEIAQRQEQIAGRMVSAPVRAGAPLPLSLLAEPPVIVRGEKVAVVARSGGAHLELEGQAQRDGRIGEVIPVRNPRSGKLFPATVRAHGGVEVTQ